MSDINLFAFCVSFVAVAAAYVYVRECWTPREQAIRVEQRPAKRLP